MDYFILLLCLYYWPHETAWANQNSVFQKCKPVVYARLGFWNDDYETLTDDWLVIATELENLE